MAIRREEEEEDEDDEEDEDEDDYNRQNSCDDTQDDVEEDGPLAELRRRAPDVTITVVRPGQQAVRPQPPPQVMACGLIYILFFINILLHYSPHAD